MTKHRFKTITLFILCWALVPLYWFADRFMGPWAPMVVVAGFGAIVITGFLWRPTDG